MDAGPIEARRLRVVQDPPPRPLAPGRALALDRAQHMLARARPTCSSRRVTTRRQVLVFGLLIAALSAAAWLWPDAAGRGLHHAAWAAFAALAGLRFAAAAMAIFPRASLDGSGWTGPVPRYAALAPLYQEPEVAAQLVAALSRLDYPVDRLDVLIVLEEDDRATEAALAALRLPAHFKIVRTPACAPRTKPKALNFALAHTRAEFVAIYDAEDIPDPAQLRSALDAFARGGAALGVVQAPLLIDNARQSWIASQFAVEYAIQFREILPALARLDLAFPLGGTSNHFRRSALEACGAWDPYNVTEDADIGYRLARDGWRMDVIAAATFEEAPATLPAWLDQRTRWIKGHLQTWLVLMRDPIAAARAMGLRNFAAMQLMLGGGLVAAFVHGPLFAVLLVSLLAPGWGVSDADWALAAFGLGSAVTGAAAAALLTRQAGHLQAALTMPFYWPLASIAAVRAAIELFTRPHHWAKTTHGLAERARDPFSDRP